jgi:uncharacterized protein (TIGR03435 family)
MKPAILLILAAVVTAQPAAAPAFEVASVKLDPVQMMGSRFQFLPGGRFSGRVWLRQLVELAYGLKNYQVTGGPAWTTSDRFLVEAKAPNAEANKAEMLLMLQNLLADRFQLKVRQENKEFAVYDLVVDKNGPKVRALKDGDPDTCMAGNSFVCGLRTMTDLADALKPFAGRPVFDKTGLAGNFDVKLDFDVRVFTDAAPPASDTKPDVFVALQEQLGPRLVPQKAMLPMVTIESVQHPTGN